MAMQLKNNVWIDMIAEVNEFSVFDEMRCGRLDVIMQVYRLLQSRWPAGRLSRTQAWILVSRHHGRLLYSNEREAPSHGNS